MSRYYPHPECEGYYGIFNDSFPPILDGVTLAVQNYVHWLRAAGLSPCVVTPWNPTKTDHPYPVLKYFSLPIWSRKPYRYGYPKLDPFIWRKLSNTNFMILHSHCPFSSGRLAVYVKKRQNVPLIGTFHSKYRSDLEHSFKRTPWLVPIVMKRILAFFNACDEVWIPQAQVEETVREYGFKGKLTVVENGNDFASVASGDIWEYKKGARKRVGLKEEEINLLFVGQHIWEKGIRVILDSLLLLRGKIGFRMNFIGGGYASDELAGLVRRYGLEDSVIINGVVTDRKVLSDYYAGSDLFLFPSYYDNAPLVIREAAAMGTPSVLLKGSTASEVVCGGVNGFLVERSPEAFSKIIAELASDRQQIRRVAMEARNTLVRSWEDVVGEVMDRYKVIISSHNRR